MRNNYGVEGGIIFATSDGFFHFENSVFKDNFASTALFAKIELSAMISRIANSNFSDNLHLDITQERTACQKLCFISQPYLDFYQNKSGLILGEKQNTYQFKLVFGDLKVDNSYFTNF